MGLSFHALLTEEFGVWTGLLDPYLFKRRDLLASFTNLPLLNKLMSAHRTVGQIYNTVFILKNRQFQLMEEVTIVTFHC